MKSALTKGLFTSYRHAPEIIEDWRPDYNATRPHTSLNGLTHNVGRALQRIREEHGWTLSEVSDKTGVAASTLAKIENNQTLPNVDVLCRLHDGLGVEFGELFQGRRFPRFARGSRAVNRRGGGIRHETPLGEYQLLSGELSKKVFQPMLVRVPKDKQEPILGSHAGEKFLYVVSGPLRFYMEPYSAVILETGESVHFDAAMPHGVTAAGDEDALFLAVCRSANSPDGDA